nr:hypothetical protein [Comamonas testosteroni]
MHAPANVSVAKPAIHAQCVKDAKRPAVSGVREHLASHPIVVVSQAVANGLRILKNFVSIHCGFAPGITRVPSYIAFDAWLDWLNSLIFGLDDEAIRS